MGRVKFVLNLISFSSSLLGPIFYFFTSMSAVAFCLTVQQSMMMMMMMMMMYLTVVEMICQRFRRSRVQCV